MQELKDILKLYKPKQRSERAEIISQIYDVYLKADDRRKLNWLRYCSWCKMNKKANTKENQEKFKKSKLFLRQLQVKQVAFFLSHIPTEDLYFVLSQVKDRANRGESVGSYILGSVKIK